MNASTIVTLETVAGSNWVLYLLKGSYWTIDNNPQVETLQKNPALVMYQQNNNSSSSSVLMKKQRKIEIPVSCMPNLKSFSFTPSAFVTNLRRLTARKIKAQLFMTLIFLFLLIA